MNKMKIKQIKSDICVLLHCKILTASLRGKREMYVLV